ncbi:hypothetical protein DFH06DRAFT_1198391 [Mycena polygramma]|nr:hypothetical protein DFH06DRAFT_1198391 [Mycena polygramma]
MPSKLDELCENCLVQKENLRRCAACGYTRYCSRECQKAHWKTHKPDCAENVQATTIAQSLGPEYTVRLPALRKWSQDFGIHIGSAAASALDILSHRERIATTMLVLYLDFLGTAAGTRYTHDIVNAEVLSIDDLAREWHGLVPQLLEQLVSVHTPIPGRLRVILLDLRFPWAYPMNFILPSEDYLRRGVLDPLWFEHLQKSVTRPGRPTRPREDVRVDVFAATLDVK